jgi:hypothetical protein
MHGNIDRGALLLLFSIGLIVGYAFASLFTRS